MNLKVKELIRELEEMDPELEVVFAYPYGDYWKNTVCGGIESVQEATAVWSDYHRAYKLPKGDEDIEEGDKQKNFVVLE